MKCYQESKLHFSIISIDSYKNDKEMTVINNKGCNYKQEFYKCLILLRIISIFTSIFIDSFSWENIFFLCIQFGLQYLIIIYLQLKKATFFLFFISIYFQWKFSLELINDLGLFGSENGVLVLAFIMHTSETSGTHRTVVCLNSLMHAFWSA